MKTTYDSSPAAPIPQSVARQQRDALRVLVFTAHVWDHLAASDPQALAQAIRAFDQADPSRCRVMKTTYDSSPAAPIPQSVARQQRDALRVLVFTAHVWDHLAASDPQALAQAIRALRLEDIDANCARWLSERLPAFRAQWPAVNV